MSSFALPELVVMQSVADAVSTLTPAERRRVAAWLMEFASQDQECPTELVVDSPKRAGQELATDFDAIDEVDFEDDSFDDYEDEAIEDDVPVAESFESFAELLEAVAPKSGAQKAVTAGYWLERMEGQESWRASEVNKLLKSAGVKVSSISIVLSNAVKSKKTMVTELARLGDKERSRKTFCLNEAGIAYVEQSIAS